MFLSKVTYRALKVYIYQYVFPNAKFRDSDNVSLASTTE